MSPKRPTQGQTNNPKHPKSASNKHPPGPSADGNNATGSPAEGPPHQQTMSGAGTASNEATITGANQKDATTGDNSSKAANSSQATGEIAAVDMLKDLVKKSLADPTPKDQDSSVNACKELSWSMEKAFGKGLGKIVLEAFKQALSLPDNLVPAEEVQVLKRIGESLSRGDLISSLSKLLATTNCIGELAAFLGDELLRIAKTEAVTGEAINEKYMHTKGHFDLVYGTAAEFHNGLVARIGSPDPKIIPAIIEEHCFSKDSMEKWETGNYCVTTNSYEEFLLIVKLIVKEYKLLMKNKKQNELPDGIAEENRKIWEPIQKRLLELQEEVSSKIQDLDFASMGSEQILIEWAPETTTNKTNPRGENHATDLLIKLVGKNTELAKLSKHYPPLSLEELILCNLYTGPLFEKYNQVHRGGPEGSDQKQKDKFESLCRGNFYTTSQFVLMSGIIKQSVLTKPGKLYRGIKDGVLPKSFFEGGNRGFRGGVDLAYLSMTRDPEVAEQYMGNSPIQTVFEISSGMIDNGADVSWLSQYPLEKEILFPPLTALEVLDTRCEGSKLCVSLRLNLNLTNDKLEEVIGKRKEVFGRLCTNLQHKAELAHFAEKTELAHSSDLWRTLLPKVSEDDLKLIKTTALRLCEKRLGDLKDSDPDFFNNDGNFREHIESSLCFASETTACSGKVLLEVARHLDSDKSQARKDGQAWHKELKPVADILLKDDFEEQEMYIEATYPRFTFPKDPKDNSWVFNALGFEERRGLWVEAGPDSLWTDEDGAKQMTLPQIADKPLPRDCHLRKLEGSTDLEEASKSLSSRWQSWPLNLPFRVNLWARFVVARPRKKQDLQAAWIQTFRTSKPDEEAAPAAARLRRIWSIERPSPIEEWLHEGLSKNSLEQWDKAFGLAAQDGLFTRMKQLRIFKNARTNYKELCSVLAGQTELEVLHFLDAGIGQKFPESFSSDSLKESCRTGRRPFPKLRELKLLETSEPAADLAKPILLAQGLLQCSSLEVLHLHWPSGLRAPFWAKLGSTLDSFPGCPWPMLTELRLPGNNFLGDDPDSDLYTFVKGLVRLPKLEVLGLTLCSLGDDFAELFCSALKDSRAGDQKEGEQKKEFKALPKLKKIKLQENRFSKTKVEELKNLLGKDRRLETKDIVIDGKSRCKVAAARVGLTSTAASQTEIRHG